MAKISNKQFVIANGSSMWPFIHSGDVLFFESADHPFKVGNVFLYHNKYGQMICHRLVKIVDNRLYFRGDMVGVIDEVVSCPQIIGLVVAIEHRGKMVNQSSYHWLFWRYWNSLPGCSRIIAFIYRLAGHFAKVGLG